MKNTKLFIISATSYKSIMNHEKRLKKTITHIKCLCTQIGFCTVQFFFVSYMKFAFKSMTSICVLQFCDDMLSFKNLTNIIFIFITTLFYYLNQKKSFAISFSYSIFSITCVERKTAVLFTT